MNNQVSPAAGNVTNQNAAALENLGTQYGFSNEAVQVLFQSIVAGGGTMAQFRHPELGGSGQWTSGGMIMIGDMFNQSLKERVNDLCFKLASLSQDQKVSTGDRFFVDTKADAAVGNWWGLELGAPSSSGSQNSARYAYFPLLKRLAIFGGTQVRIYDTGDHRISGVSQQQSTGSSLTFTSQLGPISSGDLPLVSEHSFDANTRENSEQGRSRTEKQQPVATAIRPEEAIENKTLGQSEEVFFKLERLAELRDKSVVSEEEFQTKKQELLARV